MVALPPPAYEPALVAHVIQVARAQWPGSPCEGREIVVIGAPFSGASADGEAYAATCTTRVRPGLTRYRLCVVMAHEFGHLAGYQGNDPADGLHDTAGLMGPAGPDETFAPCAPLDVPTTGEMLHEARRFAATVAGVRMAVCRLVKTWATGGLARRVYRCRAHLVVITVRGTRVLRADAAS